MEATNHDTTISYNVIGDIRGRELPEEIVLVGGHLDSWDVGTCAQDDGAGVVLALAAARQLLQQDLRPRRTVRVVHYTSEEMGGTGGRAYLDAHRHELDRHVLALESDSGSFAPARLQRGRRQHDHRRAGADAPHRWRAWPPTIGPSPRAAPASTSDSSCARA